VLACVTVSLAVQGSADAPFSEAATNLAYPVGDLILLGAIVSAVGLAGWRLDRLWGTLGIAIVAMEAADLMYMTGAQGAMGPIADALAATGMVGLARAAALAPGAQAARRTTTGAGLFVSGAGRSRSASSRSAFRCTSTPSPWGSPLPRWASCSCGWRSR
jgi:hypothetical protein